MGAFTTTLCLACAALGLDSPQDVLVDNVALVEINHFYDEQGKHVFDQLIFYDWCPVMCRFNVRAWRLIKQTAQLPQRDWKRGGYVAAWHDGDVLRKVRAEALRESWTQHDPELAEREHLPKERRADLCKLLDKDVIRR